VTSVWAVVVAGGTGSRFGGPKQFAPLGDETVLGRSVRVAAASTDGVVVVATVDHLDATSEIVQRVAPGSAVVVGGATRAASVRNGLAAVPATADLVLVHDAARPLASSALYAAVIGALVAGADAVVPAIAVVDTIRSVDGGVVDRDRLVAVQTPQGFRAGALRAAHEGAPDATDDAGLVEASGGSVVIVAGASTNLKITTPTDLVIARALVAAEEAS
jgi:2-C-methyl-D-erythritol 4-phosphate cytidylyltransferase